MVLLVFLLMANVKERYSKNDLSNLDNIDDVMSIVSYLPALLVAVQLIGKPLWKYDDVIWCDDVGRGEVDKYFDVVDGLGDMWLLLVSGNIDNHLFGWFLALNRFYFTSCFCFEYMSFWCRRCDSNGYWFALWFIDYYLRTQLEVLFYLLV